MIKLNLLDIPKGQQFPDKSKSTQAENDAGIPPEEKTVFDLFPDAPTPQDTEDRVDFDLSEEPTREFPFEESAETTTDFTSREDTPEAVVSDDSYGYDSQDSGKAGLYKILGIVGAILLLAVVIFALMPLFRGCDSTTTTPVVTQSGTNAPATEQISQPATSPQKPALPANLMNTYRQNRGENTYRIGLTKRLADMTPSKAPQQLIVVTNGYAYTSIQAENRQAIGDYRSSLQRLSGLSPKTTNLGSETINGRSRLVADFSMKTPAAKSDAGSVNINAAQNSQGFAESLRQLAQKNGLKVRYLKSGTQTQRGQMKTANFYAQVSGSKNAVFAFLDAVNRQYPAVNLDKISLFTPNGATINARNVQANLEFVFFTS